MTINKKSIEAMPVKIKKGSSWNIKKKYIQINNKWHYKIEMVYKISIPHNINRYKSN